MQDSGDARMSKWRESCKRFISLLNLSDTGFETKELPLRCRAAFVFRPRGSSKGWVPVVFRHSEYLQQNEVYVFQRCLHHRGLLIAFHNSIDDIFFLKDGLAIERNVTRLSRQDGFLAIDGAFIDKAHHYYDVLPKYQEPFNNLIARTIDDTKYSVVQEISQRVYRCLGLSTKYSVEHNHEVVGDALICHRRALESPYCYQIRRVSGRPDTTTGADFVAAMIMQGEIVRGFFLMPHAQRRSCLYPPFWKCKSVVTATVQIEYAKWYIDLENLTDEEAQEKVAVILKLNGTSNTVSLE